MKNFDDSSPNKMNESLILELVSLNWAVSSGSYTTYLQLSKKSFCSFSRVTCSCGTGMIISVFGEFTCKDWDPIKVIMSHTGEALIIDRQPCLNQAQCNKENQPHFFCHFSRQLWTAIYYQLLTLLKYPQLQKMIKEFPQPKFSQANYNLFEIINFKFYEALPRWRKQDPDPMFMTNLYRRMADVAWHSRFRTVYPHSLQYLALRAITLDDIDGLVKILKNPRFNINCEIDKKYKLNALQYAAMKNKFPVIELLLMYGANINKVDPEGNTPLMMAVSNHSLQSINSLLKNGCDRNIPNSYGTTPIQKAISQEAQYIADFIESYPQTGRKFPKFKVRLDIEKQISSPISNFLNEYQIFSNKPIKSPFNNFKGDYKIILNNFTTLGELIKEKEKITESQKRK